MSLINRLTSNGHLGEAEFAELWADGSLAGSNAAHPHLEACADCRSGFAEFCAWMDDLRTDAGAEADEAFPAERLAVQQAAVMRRLEAAEHPARVIAFPKFARPISSTTSHARRWIAAAAAAGLIVGVGLGQMMDLRHALNRSPIQSVDSRTASTGTLRPNPAIQPISATLTDDALMNELEGIASPRVPDSLVALDSLTPRARDYETRPR